MMTAIKGKQTLTLAAIVAGCVAMTLGAGVASANPILDAQAGDGGVGIVSSATGGGHYVIGFVGDPIDTKFSMSANLREDGMATGQFRHELVFFGEVVDFSGTVTCLSVDAEEGRAWIGGVITANRSEHPAFTGPTHQPGRDIWFRVVDNGEGQTAPDRSTFVGFEGNAGIITSQEYCDLQIWPEGDARTSPVTQGDIQVRP